MSRNYIRRDAHIKAVMWHGKNIDEIIDLIGEGRNVSYSDRLSFLRFDSDSGRRRVKVGSYIVNAEGKISVS